MVILQTDLPNPFHRGKVRDTYDLGDGRLLMVATDRISAFDVVLPSGIPDKGLVLANGQTDYLNAKMAVIPEGRKNNPHVQFFLTKNPCYYEGDELVCIANLSKDNLKKTAERVIRSVKVEWVC